MNMNKIYTFAEFNEFVNLGGNYSDPPHEKIINDLFKKDPDYPSIEKRRKQLVKDLEKLENIAGGFTPNPSQERKAQQLVNRYTSSVKDIGDEMDNIASFVWNHKDIDLNEKYRRIAGFHKEGTLKTLNATENYLISSRELVNDVLKNPISTSKPTSVTPPTKVTTMGSSVAKAAGGGGGGGKGALVAGLVGAGVLAAGLGVGIPLAMRNRRKKQEKKRIDKGKVKSYVRKGKLVKSHNRNYTPDK